MRENIKLLLGESAHIMVMSLKASEVQPDGARPLPPGLYVLHMYARLKMGSNKMYMAVRNMSDCPIYLKKGVQIACMVLAMPVPPAELLLEMEAFLGAKALKEDMSVSVQQEKLPEKLNLDGLSN